LRNIQPKATVTCFNARIQDLPGRTKESHHDSGLGDRIRT